MAEVVDFLPAHGNNSPQIYKWSEWLDGRVWKLKAGEDFKCNIGTIIGNARLQAKDRGLALASRVSKAEGVVYIQAYKKGHSLNGRTEAQG